MKKRKLMYAISMILCAIVITMSCVTMVLSATSQSVTSSLSVTFSGQHVNYTAQGWYQVAGSSSRTALKDSSNTFNDTLSFSASDVSTTKNLAVVENSGVISLSANNTYVLFTYKFTNTASTGAYGMEITLTGSASSDSNMTVKYLSSTSDYTVSSSGLTTQSGLVTSTTPFDHVFVGAGQTKYLYVLISIVDVYLNANYNKTSGMSFSVTCSSEMEEAGVTFYNLTYSLYAPYANVWYIELWYDSMTDANIIASDSGDDEMATEGVCPFPAGTTIYILNSYVAPDGAGSLTLKVNGVDQSWGRAPRTPEPVIRYLYTFTLNADTTIEVY